MATQGGVGDNSFIEQLRNSFDPSCVAGPIEFNMSEHTDVCIRIYDCVCVTICLDVYMYKHVHICINLYMYTHDMHTHIMSWGMCQHVHMWIY